MATLEERSKESMRHHLDDSFKTFNQEHNSMREWQFGYCQGATDQKSIDDEQYRKDMQYVGVKRQELIDEACRYIKDHIDANLVIYHNKRWSTVEELVNNLRKHLQNQ